ncbi:protein-methionine-sulfoxide reductase heme-binding subunit MsrQ [Halioxenophilus sp. WMMB6]|uniref:protein-methionine-sulfoxide reductase heme-binding subunit MsrQ n=1 Tax=Halioxenophilus sp. WMMB6 TaxID=3073815 RepID=UPI00295E319B|nr:protein-methionine-sulfoxide reductase heme-binding subunit MsrQ [Halioxenophilus sp. WMMB6]
MIRQLLPRNAIKPQHVKIVQLLLHLGCWWWLGRGYWLALNDRIGGEPVESLIHLYGDTALQLLLATLVVSPFVRYSRQSALMRLRRPLGLYSALFACAHLTIYIAYDLQFQWSTLLSEVVKRPYITVGFCAWLLVMALAVTSLPKLVRRLGRRWKQLHNCIYLIAILVCIHYWWSVKADIAEPALYCLILSVLLFFRGDKFLRYFGQLFSTIR